jgi:LCP family protein required for cell wall assembly
MAALAWVAAGLAVVIVAGVVFAAVQLFRLQSNVDTQPLNLGTEQAGLPVDLSDDPVQILVLGSDTRTGTDNRGYGAETLSPGAGNSDVMMLLTMSADRENVTVVSFPRDLMVPLPACIDPVSGASHPAQPVGQLNGALHLGGPGCTVAAINALTGLEIDHFMMADFGAVKELSEALGGVEVCVNRPVQDPKSGLDLPAGTSEIQGEQALAFLRTRQSFGDGGDAGRIRAQQSFMASMARKIKDEGTLNNLPKMYAIAEAVTRNLTVDEGLSQPTQLLKLAGRLKEVDLGNVVFVTVPTMAYPPDTNRLAIDTSKAEPLFRDLAADRGVLEEDREDPTEKPTDSTSGAPQWPFDPAAVPLSVLNASGNPGRGEDVRALLRDKGFAQAESADAAVSPATQVFHGPGYDAIAAEVAGLFGLGSAQVVPDGTVYGITVAVGEDFATGSRIRGQAVGGGLSGQTAAQVTCQASLG